MIVVDFRHLCARAGQIQLENIKPNKPQTGVRGLQVPGAKPRKAELAKVIKKGDRVKRGPDWYPYNDEVGQSCIHYHLLQSSIVIS
jgi:hypothetical protein